MPAGIYPRAPLRERVLQNLLIDPSGCLLWTGQLDKDGYGRISFRHRRISVHRLMYEWFVGPIPPGLQIDHICRVRSCASPAHMEAVTFPENMRRSRGWREPKTHCPQGHPFDEAKDSRGRRFCRRCNTAAATRYRARRTA